MPVVSVFACSSHTGLEQLVHILSPVVGWEQTVQGSSDSSRVTFARMEWFSSRPRIFARLVRLCSFASIHSWASSSMIVTL